MLLGAIARPRGRVLISALDEIEWSFIWPLRNDLNPTVGSGATPTAVRATPDKYQQSTLGSGDVLAPNVMQVTNAFFGKNVQGLPIEGASTNVLGDADDFAGVSWGATTATASAKNRADPYGVDNEAQVITPSGEEESIIFQQTATPCTSKNVIFQVWLKAGAAHNATLAVADENNYPAIAASQVYALTTSWQLCTLEHEFDGTATNLLVGIFPDVTGGSSNLPVIARMPTATVDTYVISSPCEVEVKAEQLNIVKPASLDQNEGSLYFEYYPLYDPADGITRGILNISPLVYLQPASYLQIYKTSGNALTARWQWTSSSGVTVSEAVTGSNFPRADWHKIGLTYTSTDIKLYLNGLLADSGSGSYGGATINSSAKIYLPHPSVAGPCVIREVRYYDTELSQTDMERITR